jgi:hypothetical protein
MSTDYNAFTEYSGSEMVPTGRDYVDSTAIEISEAPVAAAVREQGISIVVDGSGSMADMVTEPGETLAGMPPRTKAAAATVACSDVVSRLQASQKAANFAVGYTAFNENVTVDRAIVPVLEVPATDDFDPMQAGTGGTCIFAGLESAHAQITAWRQSRPGTLHVSNVVLLLGDGLCSQKERTMAAAERLKEIPDVTVAACLFTARGEPAQGAQLLQGIATSPKFYKTVFGAEQLREFFMASITMAGEEV